MFPALRSLRLCGHFILFKPRKNLSPLRLRSRRITLSAGTSIFDWPAVDFFTMKAKIIVTPKKAVLDPQGKTVQTALEHMGYRGVKAVHVGKYLEIELDGTDKEAARQQLNEAAHKFLSNPVIEDYKLEIE
jgi:phosphoribosylformylglycinamidine synthase